MPTPSMMNPLGESPDPGLALKQQNIDQYKNAMSGTAMPAEPAKPMSGTVKDRVNPKGAPYGSRGKEMRMPEASEWSKPLPSYKDGTDYVPKTGPAMLHKGEKVVPKEKNMAASMDVYKHITGNKKPKKEIHKIVHTRMHDGKMMTTHMHHHPEHHPDEHFAHNDMGEMHQHMENHMGTPNEGEQPGGDSQMAQLTASPSPMPSMTGEGTGAAPGTTPAGM